MTDHGRFMLDGIPFAWWVEDRSILIVESATCGHDRLRIEASENPELAAQQLAIRMLLESSRRLIACIRKNAPRVKIGDEGLVKDYGDLSLWIEQTDAVELVDVRLDVPQVDLVVETLKTVLTPA